MTCISGVGGNGTQAYEMELTRYQLLLKLIAAAIVLLVMEIIIWISDQKYPRLMVASTVV